MNERVKYLRNDMLHLSQDAFGKRLGVTGAAISRMEAGGRAVTDQMVLAICREFNVSEEWLRSGTGEILNNLSQDEELAYIVGQALPQADDFVKNTFIALGRLSQEFTAEEWQVVKKFVDALAGKDK